MSNKNTHVGVSGILYENGQILLGKRCDNDDALPGLWNTPGGGLNFREHIADGLAREFREEVGLEILSNPPTVPPFQHVEEAMHIPDRHTILFFRRVQAVPGSLLVPQALDGLSEVAWCSWDDIKFMASEGYLTPGTKNALEWFFKSTFGYIDVWKP